MNVNTKRNGFTLIELLVAISLIAILTIFALPSFYSYLLKSRRADAKEALASLQLAQEKWRGNHDTYTNTLSDLGISSTSTAGYYTITLTPGVSTGTSYEGTATPISTGPQGNDACGALKVTPTGFSGDAQCWGL